jgi:hypothetical protein
MPSNHYLPCLFIKPLFIPSSLALLYQGHRPSLATLFGDAPANYYLPHLLPLLPNTYLFLLSFVLSLPYQGHRPSLATLFGDALIDPAAKKSAQRTNTENDKGFDAAAKKVGAAQAKRISAVDEAAIRAAATAGGDASSALLEVPTEEACARRQRTMTNVDAVKRDATVHMYAGTAKWELTDRCIHHLRMSELIHEHSKDASLVVVSMPVPAIDLPALEYLAWLDMMSEKMPPTMFIRGNNQNVMTFEL